MAKLETFIQKRSHVKAALKTCDPERIQFAADMETKVRKDFRVWMTRNKANSSRIRKVGKNHRR